MVCARNFEMNGTHVEFLDANTRFLRKKQLLFVKKFN